MLDPNVKEIWVYTTMKDKKHFFEGEVVDEVLKACIPLNKIFGKKVGNVAEVMVTRSRSHLIELLQRVCTVSVRTVEIIKPMGNE
jgi:hypothetical protein